VSSATLIGAGKVREIYQVADDQLLLVATDRISAYDCVLPQNIPNKGKVLTGLAAYWFARTKDICPNHLISTSELPDIGVDVRGRATLCRKAEPFAVEFVVRGYLAGSGWKEYQRGGSVCGRTLPEGLQESSQLPEAILTPATKATTGHDENITEARAAEIVGIENYEKARRYSLEIYATAAAEARERGVIIADTKFEFGLIDGEVVLIDEALTPDSSRFWPADSYAPGGSQPSFDKQYVRDWLDDSGWDRTPPPPDLPAEVVEATAARYIEAYEKVTGSPFEQRLATAWID
jgi:phosphoribosylaminoimidazole-succinocarboxamide synthase